MLRTEGTGNGVLAGAGTGAHPAEARPWGMNPRLADRPEFYTWPLFYCVAPKKTISGSQI